MIKDDIVTLQETTEYIKAVIKSSGSFGIDQWGFTVDREQHLKQ